ncbi:MAG: GNAT family N-acetyltransferase [Thermoleophilia bacterium]
MRVATVHDGGRLVAVAPVVATRTGVWTGMHEAEEWGVPATDPEAATAAVLTLGRRLPGAVVLRPVPSDEAAMAALRDAAALDGLPLLERPIDTQPLVEIDGDWEAYWAGVPQKRNLRRARARLEQAGPVRVETVRRPDQLGDAMAEVFRIEASGWKGRGGTALVQDPVGRAFYEGLARWAADRGWLRLDLLMAGELAVAFAFDLVAHGVRYSLKIGYDEAHSAASPGRVLLAHQVESAFREGLRRFDFAGSQAGFKQVWANAQRGYAEVVLCTGGPVGRLVQGGFTAAWRARPLAKRVRARVRSRRAAA